MKKTGTFTFATREFCTAVSQERGEFAEQCTELFSRLRATETALREELRDVKEAALRANSVLETVTHCGSKVPEDLPERMEKLSETATEYGTRLSALEARDRGQKATSKEWERLATVVTDHAGRLSCLEEQEDEVRKKLCEDRDALLVCCQAFGAEVGGGIWRL